MATAAIIARNRLGAHIRNGRPDHDPAVQEARRALALANVEAIISRAIANAPPLDAAAIERIRALIPSAPTGTGS
jgi:hypothetical protein